MILSLGIATVVGLIALWRPRYGVAALILLWPSYLIRTNMHGIPTTALELSIYAVTVAAAIDYVRVRPGWTWLQLPRPWLLLFAAWSLAWLTATLFASDHQAALGGLKAWWFDATLFGGILLYTVRTADQRMLIIKATLMSGFIVSLAGIVQLIAFRSTLQDGRLSSFFHPVANYAAMFLGPIFIFGMGLILWRVLRGWFWWRVVATIGLALLLTVSFAGYLATAVGAFLLWWSLPQGQIKRWLGWGALMIIVLAGIIIPRTRYFSEHFRTTDRSSGLVRTQIWVTSWALIKQHPVVGIGPNTFEPNYRAEVPKHYWPPLEWLVAQPHNLYLALWLEIGLLGLAAFVGFMVYWTRLVWRLARQAGPAERAIMLSALAAVLAILVHGLFDTPYFKNDLALELTLLIILPWLSRAETHEA